MSQQKYNKEICIREINENLRRIFNDEPLTKPLRVLKKHCEFKKRYDLAFNLKYNLKRCSNCMKEFKAEDGETCCSDKCSKEIKERRKEYNQNPKVKEKKREYYQKSKLLSEELKNA